MKAAEAGSSRKLQEQTLSPLQGGERMMNTVSSKEGGQTRYDTAGSAGGEDIVNRSRPQTQMMAGA